MRVRRTKSKQTSNKKILAVELAEMIMLCLSMPVILQSEVDASVTLLSLWTRRNCKVLFTMRLV